MFSVSRMKQPGIKTMKSNDDKRTSHMSAPNSGSVEYYFKHFYRGIEMARGLRFSTTRGEEYAREFAKNDFLKPYEGGERSDAYHRYVLIEVKPNDQDQRKERR
jgi:hypothetical protein